MVNNGFSLATLQRSFLLLLLAVATVLFFWLVAPFTGAILWGIVAAILFAPVNDRLRAMLPGRENLCALITLLIILAVAVIPALLLGTALINEATIAFERFRAGDFDASAAFIDAERHLPGFARKWLIDYGLTDFEALQAKITQGLTNSAQVLAGRIVVIGQSTLGFFLSLGIMLYLTFFLLRDGRPLLRRIEECLPMADSQRELLINRVGTVVRATIKGSLVVGLLQGLVGGLIFWFIGVEGALLWGVAMGFFSLFPAIGTGLIWVPVTIYLLLTGQIWQGVTLLVSGVVVISSVDNVVRPMLVGRDTRMPDYVVLIATLGGFEMMGFNGFIVGPLIAALFMAVWEIFAPNRHEVADDAAEQANATTSSNN